MTRLFTCDVEKLPLVLEEASFNPNSMRRTLLRADLEIQMREHILPRLNPQSFSQVVKTLNVRVIRHLEVSGAVDLALFLAVVALLCKGSWEKRKQV